jgi:anthranilate synthase component 1
MSLVPSLDEFRRLAADANTIPVYREIAADLDTPVSAFLKLHGGSQKGDRKPQGFLLESVEGGDRWGRYSLLGTNPLMTLRALGGRLTITRRDGAVETIDGDPVEALRKVLAPFRPARVPATSPTTSCVPSSGFRRRRPTISNAQTWRASSPTTSCFSTTSRTR